jgi:hypothetical protein
LLAYLFCLSASAGDAAPAAPAVQEAELIWDYSGLSHDKRPIEIDPVSGALLPDGSIVLAANALGHYRAYKLSGNGEMLWSYTIFKDWILAAESWPGMVPLLRPRQGGAFAHGYIATGDMIGPRYFTDNGRSRPEPAWRGASPHPFTALASSSAGRATIGGAAGATDASNLLSPCPRALVVELDSRGREIWRWQFQPQHKATFVRSLQHLEYGFTLVFVDDSNRVGDPWYVHCAGDGRQQWLVWLDRGGRDFRTLLLTGGAEWVAALADGRIVTVSSVRWDAYWELDWRIYAADGSKRIFDQAVDLNRVNGQEISPEPSPRPDGPDIEGLWVGRNRLYLALRWSGFGLEQGYEVRFGAFAADGRLLWLSSPYDWHSVILGPTADESAFVVATPTGLYRAPLGK